MIKPTRLEDSRFKNTESKLRLYLENKEYIKNKPIDYSKWRSRTLTRNKKKSSKSIDNY